MRIYIDEAGTTTDMDSIIQTMQDEEQALLELRTSRLFDSGLTQAAPNDPILWRYYDRKCSRD